MFEFHGWINIRPDDTDDADPSVLDARRKTLSDETESRARDISRSSGIFTLLRGVNGLEDYLVMNGYANHRQSQVIDFFRWVAEEQPCSYRLLHVRDDEDIERGYDSVVRVFAMARGTVVESTEPSLSPCIPKIEAPWQEAGTAGQNGAEPWDGSGRGDAE